MSNSDAHRTEFTVRCACGIEYHTSDAHLGHALPCKCGRTVVITRPAPHAEPQNTRKRRKKRRFYATNSETRRALNLNFGFRGDSSIVSRILDPFRFGTRLERTVFMASWFYLAGMFVAWMMLRYASERSIPGTILAYGPRWLSLWPLAVLIPASLLLVRGALIPLLMAAWIGLVPVMGVRVSPSTLQAGDLPAKPAPGTFRVMTFNTQGGRGLIYDVDIILRDLAPDIVMLQECGERLWKKIQLQRSWHVGQFGSLCMISRWPVTRFEEMPREALLRESRGQGAGLVMRAFIDSPQGPLIAINLHLETARRGLEGMLSPEGLIPNDPFSRSAPITEERMPTDAENASRFTANAEVRVRESMVARNWATNTASDIPVVIGGDFNLPVESTIFREYWGDFVDAFEAKGNGLGWTKREGRWLRVRIDHLLTANDGPKPLRVKVAQGYQSDHLPVIADYAWPASKSSQPTR